MQGLPNKIMVYLVGQLLVTLRQNSLTVICARHGELRQCSRAHDDSDQCGASTHETQRKTTQHVVISQLVDVQAVKLSLEALVHQELHLNNVHRGLRRHTKVKALLSFVHSSALKHC